MEFSALTRAGRDLYHEATSGTHHREITLTLIRRSDGKQVASLTNRFLGGSVQGDVDRDPVTMLRCEVFDDDRVLDWAHGAHRKYAAEVTDARFVPGLDDWVEETVFTGPLDDFDRTGDVVRLLAEGPEWNAQDSVRDPDHWPARTKATHVVRSLLKASGATNRDLRIPNLRRTLPRGVTVGVKVGKDRNRHKAGFQGKRVRRLRVNREDTYWGAAEPVVEALDRELYGDGHGRFQMRRPMRRPVFRFTERTILEPVTEKATDEDDTNTWIVLGANPKGPRKRIMATARLPRRHGSSAHALRWNDTPRQVIEVVENEHLRTKRDAQRVADRRRDRALREVVEHEVQAVPVLAWLRPRSLVSVPVAGGRASARVRRWTLPLGPDADPLTIGVNHRRGWHR